MNNVKKDKIVWGMIGCGDVTEVKNGPGLYLAKHSELKGVWNRTREKAISWTERHGHGIVYDSVDAMLQDPDIDIVYIATTPDTHKDFAIRVAAAGKHALVEKPVAPTYADGMAMKAAFEAAGKKCFVCFYRRCMNRYVRLQEILTSDEIGEITGLTLMRTTKAMTNMDEWRSHPEISGGDEFTETDIHALDIMEMIMGPVQRFSYARDKEGATYSLSVKFVSGKVASGIWNYNTNTATDRFTILGTKGRIDFNFFHADTPFLITGINGYREEAVLDGPNVGMNMEQTIVNELLGEGHFSGTLDHALETLKMTSAMYYDL